MKPVLFDPTHVNRFHGKTEPGSVQSGMDTPCTLWTGLKRHKYGCFHAPHMVSAHRYAWELAHGPIPDGLCVLHRCDTPACVNPAHLFLGTHADNVADKVAKGRQARGDGSPSRLHPEHRPRGKDHFSQRTPECLARGEEANKSDLTEDDVRRIRAAYVPRQNGGLAALAKQYSVAPSSIHEIVRRKTWAHVI